MDDLDGLHRFRQSDAWLYSVIAVSALLALIASFVLSVDAIALAVDPQAQLGCNISKVLSCGAVGVSWQANLLGFPNAFLGLVAEPVAITVAVAALGKVRFPRWFMAGMQVMFTVSMVFAYWLLSQSMFVIGALCPWCLVVTLTSTLVFFAITAVNLRDHNLYLPARVQAAAEAAARMGLDLLIVVLWLAGLLALLLVKYGAVLFA